MSDNSGYSKYIKAIEPANSLYVKMGKGLILGLILLVSLYALSRYNYLFFHSLSELFSIIVGVCLFVIAWNSRHLSENRAFVLIGIAYLFISAIDLVHMLSYQGMGIITQDWGANPATELWIAARFMESLSFLLFAFLLFKHVHYSFVLAAYSAITALIFMTIFYWRIFPDCYVDGLGLTLFKKVSEYIICIILLAALLLLYRKKNNLDKTSYRLLAISIIFTIFGELAFTFYISVYGISNFVGHYFKILSFVFLYYALIRNSFKKPYETLFRELNKSEETYKSLFEQMMNGAASHEIICDIDGTPVDYRFLAINTAFERIIGLKEEDVIGKTVLEVFPGTEPFWIETYGRVALSGESIKFDNYSKQMNKHFQVSSYSLKYGQFVTVFNDITEQKSSEMEKDKLIAALQKASDEIRMLQDILPICSHCKKVRDEKGSWSQIDSYIRDHSNTNFSHAICPECAKQYYPDIEIYNDDGELAEE